METEAFGFETLSKQEALERKNPRLSKLESNFWPSLQNYLKTLETSLRKEQERNPTSRKIALIQDEFRNATRKSESLWEARERKITLTALKNSRQDLSAAPENALREEQAFYQELVLTFRKYLPPVIAALEKPSEASAIPLTSRSALPPASQYPAPSAAAAVPPTPAPATAGAAGGKPAEDQLTVRALVDIPPFVGLDGRTYRLKKGDVLTMQKKMVDLLVKRGQVALMG